MSWCKKDINSIANALELLLSCTNPQTWQTYRSSDIREVSLHVKRERVRVTSHLGAQFRYTSCSCTHLGFLHVATWALRNKDIDTSKWHDNSPLNALVNKNQCTLHNDILEHGKQDYRQLLAVIVSSGFVSISPLCELFDYTLKSRRVTCSLP